MKTVNRCAKVIKSGLFINDRERNGASIMWNGITGKRRNRFIAYIIIAGIAAGLAGFAGGRWWMLSQYPMLRQPAFSNLDKTYKEVLNEYLNGAEAESLIHGAAEGMVASLKDPYSVYYTREKGSTYLERYVDHFVGIGIELRVENGDFIINSVMKEAPAEKAGLQPNDVVTAVDGNSLKGKTLADLISLTRGEEGTDVLLTIIRETMKEPFDVRITRAAVPVTTVTSGLLDGGIGSIRISRFAESTAKEFEQAVVGLKEQGMTGLLLDLRANSGGLLNPAIDIAGLIVPKNEIIVQVVYKDEKRKVTHRSKQKEPWTIPVVALIDESTASSAEVLAAALRTSAQAELVGVKTFGKGIVQTFIQFDDQSVLKLTEAQWKTPDDKWIHGQGIEPTIAVQMPEYASLPALPSDVNLSVGSYGQDVNTAERILKALGYPSEGREGIYDEAMEKAVRQFQVDERLDVEGIISGRTAYRLVERLRDKIMREDPQLKRGKELLLQKTER
ncbi:S41 family peptidase [Paenibacillus tarimensis]